MRESEQKRTILDGRVSELNGELVQLKGEISQLRPLKGELEEKEQRLIELLDMQKNSD